MENVRGIMLYWQFFPFIFCQVRKYQNVQKVPSLPKTLTKYFFRFQCHTTEAAKLETEVTKAQDTITAAQQLISQLDGEHTRWNTQVCYECASVWDTFAKKGAHLPCKSNRRWERDGDGGRQTGGCILLSWVPSGCFYPTIASVCTLIKTLNLFMTHTLTHSLTLAASLRACTKALVYSLPIYFPT